MAALSYRDRPFDDFFLVSWILEKKSFNIGHQPIVTLEANYLLSLLKMRQDPLKYQLDGAQNGLTYINNSSVGKPTSWAAKRHG